MWMTGKSWRRIPLLIGPLFGMTLALVVIGGISAVPAVAKQRLVPSAGEVSMRADFDSRSRDRELVDRTDSFRSVCNA